MKAAKAVLLLSTLLTTPAAIWAVDLDLTLEGGTFTVLAGDKLDVRVVNMVPEKHEYTFSFIKQAVEIEKLKLPGAAAVTTTVKSLAAAPSACDAVLNLLQTELSVAKDESEVKKAVAKARGAAIPMGEQCERQVDIVVATTTQFSRTETLRGGEELIVTVERLDPIDADKNRKKTWKFVVTTGPRGKWMTHYGFSFLQDRDERYFTKEVGTGDFVIQKKKDHDSYDFEPTVVFTWVPARLQLRQWIPAFAAGVGIDFNKPVVFAGIAALVGDNVNIFAGLAGHKQKRLDGKFHEDQHVKEALEGTNLEEEVFDGNIVLGVGFRFDGNPFKKAEDKKDDKKAGQSGGGTQ